MSSLLIKSKYNISFINVHIINNIKFSLVCINIFINVLCYNIHQPQQINSRQIIIQYDWNLYGDYSTRGIARNLNGCGALVTPRTPSRDGN